MTTLRAALIGLGKMGLSHQAIVNSHPSVQLRAICDTSTYMLDVLSKFTGVSTYTDYHKMFEEEALDCVFVATPSRYHAEIVEKALERNLHVFCEKPFALDARTGYDLADVADKKQLINQVGYHYRFVATFNEAKRLLTKGVLGKLHHVRAEAYGPVVLRPKGSTWRSRKQEGGGCLLDYACHAIDLLNHILGKPASVSGTIINSVFSDDVDDEIYSTLTFGDGFHGQLAANWSDESFRKMAVKLSFWGTEGRINVDRQEIQIYLRNRPEPGDDLKRGWNLRYTTELTKPVWFYMRGEEYSAQIEHFIQCIVSGSSAISTFRTASDAAAVVASMRTDANRIRTLLEEPTEGNPNASTAAPLPRARSWMRALLGRTSQ